MSWWLIVLISVLGYSLLITINNIVKDLGSGEYMNWDDFILGGIFTWLIWFTTFIVRKAKRLKKRSKYKSLIKDSEGNIYWVDFEKVDKILEDETLDFKFTEGKQFFEFYDYWDKSMCFRGPNVRYAPKIVWKQFPKLNLRKYEKENEEYGKD